MASKQIQELLDAIAKASSGVMKSADKAVPPCPACGQPVPVSTPEPEQKPDNE